MNIGFWLIFLTGCFMIVRPFWLKVNLKTFSVSVKGKYVGKEHKIISQRGAANREEYYAPIFEYWYNGMKYRKATEQCWPDWRIKAKYGKNREYEIFLNPKKPDKIIVERKIESESAMLLIVIGVLFCIYAFLVF